MMRFTAATAVIALALAGCAGTETTTSESTNSAAAVEQSPSADFSPSTADFVVTLKVTKKQCFGSAGCNVTVEPEITETGFRVENGKAVRTDLPSEGSIDLTYKVSGDESGPVIDTATLDLADGTYSSSKISLSTASSGVRPKAKVTDVEYTS